MPQRSQIHVPLGLAARALDFQPRVAAIHGLIDRRRRIDRAAISPYFFVPAFAEQLVGLADQRCSLGSGLSRLRGEDRRHRTRPAELLPEGLAVASGQRGRMVLGGHGYAAWLGAVVSRP